MLISFLGEKKHLFIFLFCSVIRQLVLHNQSIYDVEGDAKMFWPNAMPDSGMEVSGTGAGMNFEYYAPAMYRGNKFHWNPYFAVIHPERLTYGWKGPTLQTCMQDQSFFVLWIYFNLPNSVASWRPEMRGVGVAIRRDSLHKCLVDNKLECCCASI